MTSVLRADPFLSFLHDSMFSDIPQPNQQEDLAHSSNTQAQEEIQGVRPKRVTTKPKKWIDFVSHK